MEENRSNLSEVGSRRSEISIAMQEKVDEEENEEKEEEVEEELKFPKTDPTQFFTQLGTLVAVFGVTMDMTMNVIQDVTAQNVNGLIANGLVLGLIHIPTLCALLFVMCKDRVKFLIKGAIHVSKIVIKKTRRSGKNRENNNVSKNNNSQKIMSILQQEVGIQDLKEKIEIQPIQESLDSMGIVKVPNVVETNYKLFGDRNSMTSTSSGRTITPNLSYIDINQRHGQGNSTMDRYEKRGYRKEDEQYITRYHNDALSQTSIESYQSFMETPSLKTKRSNQGLNSSRNGETRQMVHNFPDQDNDSINDSVCSVREYTSTKSHQRNEAPYLNGQQGHPARRSHNSEQNDMTGEYLGTSRANVNRKDWDYEARKEDFTRKRSPSNSNRYRSGSSRAVGRYEHTLTDKDSVLSRSNKHSEKRRKRRSGSKEDKGKYGMSMSNVDERSKSVSRTGMMSRVASRERRERETFGRDNMSFQDDEGLPESESGVRGVVAKDGFDRTGKSKARDTYYIDEERNYVNRSKEREGRKRDPFVSGKTVGKSDESVHIGKVSSSFSVQAENRYRINSDSDHQSKDYIHRSTNGIDPSGDHPASQRSRLKVKGNDRQQNPTSAGVITPKTTSNLNISEIESDEEKILLMIRKITQGKSKKETISSNESQQQQQHEQQEQQHLPNKELKGRSSHAEGKSVVDIEGRGRKHGRRKR